MKALIATVILLLAAAASASAQNTNEAEHGSSIHGPGYVFASSAVSVG